MSQRSLLRSAEDLIARLDERVRTLERKRATLTSDVVNTVAVPGPPGPAGADGAPGANGATGPAGPAATVSISDEGTPLGAFASLDIVGDMLEASLAGTAATVTASLIADPRYRMMIAV